MIKFNLADALLETVDMRSILREIEIDVSNLPVSNRFYCLLLGLPTSSLDQIRESGPITLGCGNLKLTLRQTERAETSSLAGLTFETDDLTTLYARLKKARLAALSPVKSSDENYDWFVCCDPDGREISVVGRHVNRSFLEAAHMAPI